jgi:hypothetical protein
MPFQLYSAVCWYSCIFVDCSHVITWLGYVWYLAPFLLRNGMEHTKTNKLTAFRTAKQKSAWWQPQPRGGIFQVLATSTELAHKIEQKFSYWHFVIPGVPTNIDTWCVICVGFNRTLRQWRREVGYFLMFSLCHVFRWRRPTSRFECRQKRMCIIDGWIVFDGYPFRNYACSWSATEKKCSWFSSW